MTAALADREFEAGYRLGFALGCDLGRQRGRDEEAAAWQAIMTGYSELIKQPDREALAAARVVDHQPCAMKCRRCSRCIHSLDWWSRGGRPFLGVEQERARARAVRHDAPGDDSRAVAQR